MPIITIRTLGHRGRVGNAIFQYMIGCAYARFVGATLQTPSDWWGRKVFEVADKDPAISIQLPQTNCDSNPSKPLFYFKGEVNLDLYGYFQHRVFTDLYSRADVLEWLKLKPEFEDMLIKCSTQPAAHLRRGDFLTNPVHARQYCLVSRNSYQKAITRFGIPRPVRMFSGGNLHDDWREREQRLEFLNDWLEMISASHLLRANSSFSFWAGVLSKGKVYAPIVGDKVGDQDRIEFTEGNWPNLAGKHKNQSDLHLKE